MQNPASGTVRELPVSDGESVPYGITAGPDGALWVALESGAVARVAP